LSIIDSETRLIELLIAAIDLSSGKLRWNLEQVMSLVQRPGEGSFWGACAPTLAIGLLSRAPAKRRQGILEALKDFKSGLIT
jgi:hypothetical protein